MSEHRITGGDVELISVSDGFPTRSPLMPFPRPWRGESTEVSDL